MSFEAAWGFDPNKAIEGSRLSPSEMERDEITYTAEEQRAARIPSAAHSQIYELRRMYRL